MHQFQAASQKLNVELHPGKLSILSTHSELGRDVCAALELPQSVCKPSVTYLGVDEAAGARRCAQRARLKQK
eukprot:9185869-Pyramimonas_sp.AAC.1